MQKRQLPDKIRKQRICGFILLCTAAIITVLLLFSAGRRFVYGVFGYAVYAYLVGAYLISLLLIIGKTPKIKGGRAAIYVLLFFSIVLTIHIGLSAELIPSARYLEATYNADTVGGALMGLPASLLHLFPNYTFMLVVSFVIAAVFGLLALYPLVSKIGSGEGRKRVGTPCAEDKEISDVDEDRRIENAFSSEDDYTSNSVINASDDNYMGGLIDSRERNARRASEVLFNGGSTEKRPDNNDYSILRGLGQDSDDALYTNQGRTRIMNENLRLRSPEEEYAERYGRGQIDDRYTPRDAGRLSTDAQYVPRKPVAQDPYVDGGYTAPADRTRSGDSGQAPVAPREPIGSRPAEPGISASRTAYDVLYSDPIKPVLIPDDEPIAARSSEPTAVRPEPVPVRSEPYAEPTRPTQQQTKREMSDAERREYLFKPVTSDEYGNMGLFKNLLEEDEDEEPVAAVYSVDRREQNTDRVAKANETQANKPEPARVDPVSAPKPEQKPTPRAVPDKKPVYTSREMGKEQAPDLAAASGVVQSGMFPSADKEPYKPKPYRAPTLDLLNDYGAASSDFPDDYEEVKNRIDVTMQEFNVPAEVINAKRGPTFTMYYLSLGPGYKITRVTNLKENLKMRLRVKNLRIQAPIEGEDAFGIELPNSSRDTVGLKTIIQTDAFTKDDKGIKIALGKTFDGRPYVADLAKMPHLLVAGATGTGKSVFLNSVIVSILYKYSPEDVRMIMIDPKRVEMSVYRGLPNLLIKETIKEAKHALNVLKWLTEEMDRRYAFFEQVGCSNIEQYNTVFRDKDREPKMQRIVLIIDEMADLMIKSKDNKVEEYIVRIAQLARACGIHMIIATQRPTAEVITGLIKGNILHRVAFTVKSNLDSRVILDDGGAEELLGLGDMLYSMPGSMVRLQGTMIDIGEIKEVCDYIRSHNDGNFDDSIMEAITYEAPAPEPEVKVSAQEERDADFEQQLRVILKSFILSGRASVSSAQASHHVGYIKARKLVDAMTERGFLSQGDGAKPREIMISLDRYYEIFGQDADAPGAPTVYDTFSGDDADDDSDDDNE